MHQDVEKAEGQCFARDDTWQEVQGSDVLSYNLSAASILSHFKEES